MAREVGRLEFAGSKELLQRLEQLGENVKTGAGQALRAAARPIIAIAKPLSPRRTGQLVRSLGVVVRKPRSSRGVPYAAIGAQRGFKESKDVGGGRVRMVDPAKYSHLAERGARPHDIPVPVRGKDGAVKRVKIWKHPGARPRPFLEPAVISGGPQAGPIIANVLRKVIAKAESKVLTL